MTSGPATHENILLCDSCRSNPMLLLGHGYQHTSQQPTIPCRQPSFPNAMATNLEEVAAAPGSSRSRGGRQIEAQHNGQGAGEHPLICTVVLAHSEILLHCSMHFASSLAVFPNLIVWPPLEAVLGVSSDKRKPAVLSVTLLEECF